MRRLKYPRLAIWPERAEHVLTFYEFPPGLRRLVHANDRARFSDKRPRRMPRKRIRFATEEAWRSGSSRCPAPQRGPGRAEGEVLEGDS